MMGNVRAKPVSTADIRNVAEFLRRMIGVSSDRPLNVTKSLDILTFQFSRYGFNYQILPDSSPIFEKGEEAKTDVVSGMIYIKESVFQEASHKRYCRAKFTIAHEIGHFVMHHAFNMLDFSRSNVKGPLKIYEDPEWQADVFASELLMPYVQCLSLSPDEIRRKYHVTKGAAWTRYSKIHRSKEGKYMS